MQTTIYALATPPGKSGVAIIRISGATSKSVLAALGVAPLPLPRMAALHTLTHPASRAAIDQALVIYFPGPKSFTGEDVAELHIHGSRAVIQLVLEALSGLPDLRLAEPGEFSRRAFMNGRMDLTQAEGLADLIDAETSAQARQALRQASGEMGKLYEDWRDKMIGCMARLEAYIDFPDEPLPPELEHEINSHVANLKNALATHMADNGRGERLREGAKIVILGAPNAGKSSLLNYLAKREVAIVSPIPGTTRDALEVHLDIKGYPVTLIDTAGIRASQDVIEAEGVKRSLKHADDADIKLVLLDGETLPTIPDDITEQLQNHSNAPMFIAITKQDVAPQKKAIEAEAYPVSSVTGQGIEALFTAIGKALDDLLNPGETPLITRARHRQEVESAHSALTLYMNRAGQPIELRAELLRQAAAALGRVTGRIDVEDVLDKLFSTFCIGK